MNDTLDETVILILPKSQKPVLGSFSCRLLTWVQCYQTFWMQLRLYCCKLDQNYREIGQYARVLRGRKFYNIGQR
jgi:hypothetical protein